MKRGLDSLRVQIASDGLSGPNGFLDSRLLQSAFLFASLIVSMGLSFITGIITARTLGPEGYGDLKFITTIWSLLALLSTFGLFHSGSRVLAVEKESGKIREIIGTILLVASIIGICLSILTSFIAIPLDRFLHSHVASILITLAPLVFILPFQTSLALILQGTNRIYLLAILNSLPPLLYVSTLVVLSHFHLITTINVLSSNLITTIPVILCIIIFLRPSFKSTKHWGRVLREQNATYGRPVYFGSLANVATSYLNSLAIFYWADNISIGFYSLANSLTEPLKLVPNAVATSSFRSFASQQKVSRKVLYATLSAALLTLAASILLFGKPLSWIYTDEFSPVGNMARLMAIGAIAHGFGDFYNRFLGAHGKGVILRNVAYIVGGVNILGFILLVPVWGAWGAAVIAVLAGFTYFSLMFYYYRQHTRIGMKKTETAIQTGGDKAITETTLEDHRELQQIADKDTMDASCSKQIVILLDSFGFPNGMASTQRVYLIAKALVHNRFHVKVLCARVHERQPFVINKEVKGIYDGIYFEFTPGTTIRSHRFWVRRYVDVKGLVLAVARLISFRMKNQVDCIYYYGNIMQISMNRWIFYLTARILRVPIVTDISEPPWVLSHPEKWYSRPLSPVNEVNGVILISKFLEDWVLAESLKKQKTIPILNLPILVDVNEQPPIETKSSEADMVVLFAGDDPKTIDFIFQAMEGVWQVYPECRLIITGFEPSKSQKEWLATLMENSLADGRVSITGYLSRNTLLQFYKNASVLLAPLFEDVRSRARFPTKIAEYLCSGTPVVTNGIGDVGRFLKDGDTAFVSVPNDPEKFANKIIEALCPENRSKTIRVGENGRIVAETFFNIETHYGPIAAFFHTVCKKSHQ